ncbi:hypothetical protein [Ralstonia wenshanensis]|uniref:hypothetical protein n=1 Tax=Ralstonia wenshanensis TaxID=2842456 RepID=UPI003D98995D
MTGTIKYALGVVALSGFLLSLLAHVMALMGIDLSASVPAIWDLHFGIFVVFIPFVLFARKGVAARTSMLGIAADMPRWVVMLESIAMTGSVANSHLYGYDAPRPTT